MPELVSKGPSIPVRLMNELDSGRLVFFCGAGISMGEGSNLPDFADLVVQVYEDQRINPDEVEAEALHHDEPKRTRRRPQFDKALGLLERPERLGARALRETVKRLLSKPPSGPLKVHEALLTLSRHQRGHRLVTTNFDNRFVGANPDLKLIDEAPKLPVPKRHNWESVVHLHGRIVPDEDGSNLVLTAADFGRAYLTERWAARFVTELFREFAVVFIGYGVSDPVMSYIVDALAAERDKGARFSRAYAFAHHEQRLGEPDKTRRAWLAKNIDPILYNNTDNHRLLAETLAEWARIRNDPFHARSQIALNDITKLPAGPDDPIVERALWALEDPVAAGALAESPPIVDERDFSKIGRWLELFTQGGLLQCTSIETNHSTGVQRPAVVSLVDHGFQELSPYNLDTTRTSLAGWIARHLHVPDVLAWVLRNGGHVHRQLRNFVQMQLATAEADIPPRLRLLWTVLTNYEPIRHQRFLWAPMHYQNARSDAERCGIEDAAVASMAPRLVVLAGPSTRLRIERNIDSTATPIPAVEACGHLQVFVSEEDARHSVEPILKSDGVLARHAETLTSFLAHALVLADEDDEIYSNSALLRPSIAAHDQNRHHSAAGLNHLIDLARDSYQALSAKDRDRANNLLRRWEHYNRPLFQRLALNALAETPKADIHLAKRLLVSGRKPGVWEWELQREVLRFFRLAGLRLPRTLRAEIVRAIHAGPKSNPRRPPPNYAALIRRQKALRLFKLTTSGARLDKRSRAIAEQYDPPPLGEPIERDEFTIWRGTPRWVGEEELAPTDLRDATVAEVATEIENDNIEPVAFRSLVGVKPVKVTRALLKLARRDIWPAMPWQRLLWTVTEPGSEPTPATRLQTHIAQILACAPDTLFEENGSAAADFAKGLANAYATNREQEYATLWMRVWRAMSAIAPPSDAVTDDPLMEALNHPAGKLADGAIARLLNYEPRAGEQLPEPVRPYFEAIAGDAAGHLGRVMLATRLYFLFGVDPDWIEARLIPLFSLGRSEEASNLWYAYAWSGTIGPNLLLALKEPFLEVLRAGDANVRTEQNLAAMFVVICLEAPTELTDDEVHSVVDRMSEDALKTVLGCLKDRLRGDPTAQAQNWRDRIGPWLECFWPEAAVQNTAGTAEAMLAMLANCGDAFPEAARWSLNYLQPIQQGLFRLQRDGQAGRYPHIALRVLDKVVGRTGRPAPDQYTLRQILNEIRVKDPGVEADATFQRLYQIANR